MTEVMGFHSGMGLLAADFCDTYGLSSCLLTCLLIRTKLLCWELPDGDATDLGKDLGPPPPNSQGSSEVFSPTASKDLGPAGDRGSQLASDASPH